MPQEQVVVYFAETGQPCRMHSVDAAEALRLGDYVSTPPDGLALGDHAMWQATSRGLPLPPELQTPEVRALNRAQAASEAEAATRRAAIQQGLVVPDIMPIAAGVLHGKEEITPAPDGPLTTTPLPSVRQRR